MPGTITALTPAGSISSACAICANPNGALAMATEPLGIALGFTISICLSFTLGSMLVVFLKLAGLLDGKSAALAYIGEVIPGVEALPAWTGLVWRCVSKAAKGVIMKKALGGVANMASGLVLPETPVGEAMQQGTQLGIAQAINWTGEEGDTEAPAQQEISRKYNTMQDIKTRPLRASNNNTPRAANDNLIRREQYAA
jgi:hypothetical protein